MICIAAGMPRSGSTLLFNIMRLVMEERWGGALKSGWELDLRKTEGARAVLVKTHNLRSVHVVSAQVIFYTYRDIRTAAVSHFRAFGQMPTMEMLEDWVLEWEKAKTLATGLIAYNKLVNDKLHFINLFRGIFDVRTDRDLLADLEAIRFPEGDRYSPKTLYHPHHMTNTRDDEWKEILDPVFQAQISARFGTWFRKVGFEE